MSKNNIYSSILNETGQSHNTRRHLYEEIEESLEKPVVSYFTSFNYPVMISDDDAEMLEQVLLTMDLSKGLALLISSPGGDGLAAERIINLCRRYSGTESFTAIVPGKAKSAGTMICMGAENIIMGKGSELGPVDPQVTIPDDGGYKRFSAYSLIKSYNDLFKRATKEKGRIEPYLQQLEKYDAREIKDYETAIDLSNDIVIKNLKTGMLKDKSDKTIKKLINRFINPTFTKNHGRPICREDAKCAQLDIINSETIVCWNAIFHLYSRLNYFTNNVVSKAIESKGESFTVDIPKLKLR